MEDIELKGKMPCEPDARESPRRLLDVIEQTSEKMRHELVRRLDGQREMLLEIRMGYLKTKRSFDRLKAGTCDRTFGAKGSKGFFGRKYHRKRRSLSGEVRVDDMDDWIPKEDWDDNTPLTVEESVSSSEENQANECDKSDKKNDSVRGGGVVLKLDLTRVNPPPQQHA